MVGSDYRAEVGYIRRKGYFELTPAISYRFLPQSGNLISHGPSFRLQTLLDKKGRLSDRQIQAGYSFEFQSKETLSFDFRENYVRLLAPFDPTNTGGPKLPAGSTFDWNEGGVTYVSDSRKLLNYELGTRYGGYYNGTHWNVSGKLYHRVQPITNLAIAGSYDRISLPSPYKDANLYLFGPRLDFTFTDNLFLTTYVQYNNQIDNLNLNIRLQWRFAPVSDLFIVYGDNSYPGDFQNKNRGLVMKLSYWFN
jgi:hypothetical protein